MKIKNVVNTTGRVCNCENWLAHWERFSKKKASYCSESGCLKTTDLVGAHVRKVGSTDTTIYIIPLCKEHNKSTDEMETYQGYPLIPENQCK